MQNPNYTVPGLNLSSERRSEKKRIIGKLALPDRMRRGYSRRMISLSHAVLRTDRGTAYGVAAFTEPELRRLLDNPEDLLWQNLSRSVKISHESLIVRAEVKVLERAVRVAYKRYSPRNWWKSFLGLFRRSRALDAWDRAHSLLACNIATAHPVAAFQPSGWHRGKSYLATEWIEGAKNLHAYGWRLADRPPADRLRRAAECAENLGRLVGRMHASQISHRDLKGANVLVVERSDGVKIHLIDMDGVRIRKSLRPIRREADLARLAASLEAHPWVARTICCRFLRAYAAEFAPGTIAWKPLWRAVARRSRRIVTQKRRRGQQVL